MMALATMMMAPCHEGVLVVETSAPHTRWTCGRHLLGVEAVEVGEGGPLSRSCRGAQLRTGFATHPRS